MTRQKTMARSEWASIGVSTVQTDQPQTAAPSTALPPNRDASIAPGICDTR
jgi:hypothetical protein